MANGKNTVEEMRKYVGALPSMFATSPASRTVIKSLESAPPQGGSDVSFQFGIPPAFSTPLASGGAIVSRHIVNALGNLGSQTSFFEQCGGYYTFDEAQCAAIGGYPKDAILSFYDEDSSLFRRVRSLVDDNTWNFLTKGVDGVHWAYADDMGMMSMHVDYANGEDISDRLFLDSGEPDWIEVDENSVLNCLATGFIDILANTSLLGRQSQNGFYSPYFSDTYGYSILDVSGSGGGFQSLWIGQWSSETHGFRSNDKWMIEYESVITGFGASIALGAGDRIRVRNFITQTPKDPDDPMFDEAGFPSDAPIRLIGREYFPAVGGSDAAWDRGYLTKVALLSPMRFKKL